MNVLEQAQLSRTLGDALLRIQRVEAYFSGQEIGTARIGTASITNAKIEDASITNAKIANATIENAKIASLDAGKITTGFLNADRIQAGTITADKLDVSTLSAITANIGSINAGTINSTLITGSVIRTKDSTSRVELTSSDQALTVYQSGNRRARIQQGNFFLYGNGAIKLYQDSSIYGQIDCSSTTYSILHNGTGGGDLYIQAADGGDVFVFSDGDINLNAPVVRLSAGTSKSAIVETSAGYNAIYCAESPDVWFMDFEDDDLFGEVTEGKSVRFNCTNGKTLTLRKRKGFANTRFESKTDDQMIKNNKLYAE